MQQNSQVSYYTLTACRNDDRDMNVGLEAGALIRQASHIG